MFLVQKSKTATMTRRIKGNIETLFKNNKQYENAYNQCLENQNI